MKRTLAVWCTMAAGLVAHVGPALASGTCVDNYDMAHACQVTWTRPGPTQVPGQFYDSGAFQSVGASLFYRFTVPSNAHGTFLGVLAMTKPFDPFGPPDGFCPPGEDGFLYQTLYDSSGNRLYDGRASVPPCGAWSLQYPYLTLGATYYFSITSTSAPITWSMDMDGSSFQTFGPSTAAVSTVPDLKPGSRLSTVGSRLRAHHLTLGRVRYRHNRHVPKGRFVRFTPKSGTRLADGAPVGIVVSLGK